MALGDDGWGNGFDNLPEQKSRSPEQGGAPRKLMSGDDWRALEDDERAAAPQPVATRLEMGDPRSNGSTAGHEPGVLPQGMTFHAGELADAYIAGATSARRHHPITDEQLRRATDAYVKLAHLKRITPS